MSEGGFLNFLGPVMRAGLHLIKHLLTSGARNVLLQLGVTAAAASETNPAIQKKIIFQEWLRW